MQEIFNSAIRSINRASSMMGYSLGGDMGHFAELPKDSHLNTAHCRDIVQKFRLFFRPENGFPFVDETPELERSVTISETSEDRRFPKCWPSRYVNITMNYAGFVNWEYDENFNYAPVFRKYRPLQPEFPLAFTEEPRHCAIEKYIENLRHLKSAADTLKRLTLPSSWCRNMNFRREESSGSYRDQIPIVTETVSESNVLPTPGFLENIDYGRSLDDTGTWYGGIYITTYTVSYVRNPLPFPIVARFFFADVPQITGNGYFVMDPGPSDYVGFSVPSIVEQDQLLRTQSFYPGDSITDVTFQTVELELEPGEEKVFPGSPVDYPCVLREEFHSLIQNGEADSLLKVSGARGKTVQTLLADWREDAPVL